MKFVKLHSYDMFYDKVKDVIIPVNAITALEDVKGENGRGVTCVYLTSCDSFTVTEGWSDIVRMIKEAVEF